MGVAAPLALHELVQLFALLPGKGGILFSKRFSLLISLRGGWVVAAPAALHSQCSSLRCCQKKGVFSFAKENTPFVSRPLHGAGNKHFPLGRCEDCCYTIKGSVWTQLPEIMLPFGSIVPGDCLMDTKRLRDLREDNDKTQQQIADMLNMHRSVYRRYESGEREIPVWAVIKLADYYRVSTDYLLGLTDDPARR